VLEVQRIIMGWLYGTLRA